MKIEYSPKTATGEWIYYRKQTYRILGSSNYRGLSIHPNTSEFFMRGTVLHLL